MTERIGEKENLSGGYKEKELRDKKECEQGLRILIERINNLSLQVYGKGKRIEWFHGKQRDFKDKIKKLYPDFESYLSYHVLIGSSTFIDIIKNLDFSEPHSVKTFLENLIEELNDKIGEVESKD